MPSLQGESPLLVLVAASTILLMGMVAVAVRVVVAAVLVAVVTVIIFLPVLLLHQPSTLGPLQQLGPIPRQAQRLSNTTTEKSFQEM